jgi:hypothetical protein
MRNLISTVIGCLQSRMEEVSGVSATGSTVVDLSGDSHLQVRPSK